MKRDYKLVQPNYCQELVSDNEVERVGDIVIREDILSL